MSDHGFDVCALDGVSPRVIDAPLIPWHDKCGTRWLPQYSPQPPFDQYWADWMETNHIVAWRKHKTQITWWWEHMCRNVIKGGECK